MWYQNFLKRFRALRTKSIYTELAIFGTIIIGIGYLADNTDPLLITGTFDFLLLWLAIITLFYGTGAGLLFWILFVIAGVSFYESAVYTPIILENLLFVFLFGEFFVFWNSKIDRLNGKNEYLQLRFREISNAFFTLKTSHDQLEKVYILQPASITYVISQILRDEFDNVERFGEKTLKALHKFFHIDDAMIWRFADNKPAQFIASVGDIDKNINLSDEIMKKLFDAYRSVYLKDLKNNDDSELDYICAIPILNRNNDIETLLIIKTIPFVFYNLDNLLKVEVVFNYFWGEYQKREYLTKEHFHDELEINFRYEIRRLQELQQKFDIGSSIYVLKTSDEYCSLEIDSFIKKGMRILDHRMYKVCKEHYIHIFLFPFEDESGVNGFEKRLVGFMGNNFYKKVERRSTNINGFEYILEWSGCQ